MFKHVLVAIDLGNTDSAKRLVEVAADLAKQHKASLRCVTVVPSYSSSLVGSFFPSDYEGKVLQATADQLDKFIASLSLGLDCDKNVAHGTVYDEILASARKFDCDLIVVGAHRPELSDYLLGANAARVARHAKQSVFVVR